jgi:hypothetical protein
MEQLQFLFKIIGLGSASGLVYHNNTIVAVGDNSSYLYEYTISNEKLERYPLQENAQENTLKKIKKDFEAITQFEDTIYVFGSGSTENRNTMVQIDAKTKKVITTQDLSMLYASMQSFGEINPEDFNLEGAIYNGENWFLFNRSNGKKSKNAIFTISGKNLTDEFSILHNKFKLPKIKGVETSFTDAILVDDQIYFLATAEATESTYHDGEVLGSIIGQIDVAKMKLKSHKIISKTNKLEGITLVEETPETISFLLCEDNDIEVLESNIYKITLKK